MKEETHYVKIENWSKCGDNPPFKAGAYLLRQKRHGKPVIAHYDSAASENHLSHWTYQGIAFYVRDCEWAHLPE